jgi:hypothetical protein
MDFPLQNMTVLLTQLGHSCKSGYTSLYNWDKKNILEPG